MEGKVDSISIWLSQASETYHPAKFLTLQAALEMKERNFKNAHNLLKKSLKQDKTLYITHDLLAELYQEKGDVEKQKVHELWSKRCKGRLE